MKKLFLIFFLFPVLIFGQSAGNTGLSFLKFGFGARNIAMGDAGNAASNDLSALYYNPAKLSSLWMNEVIFMHNSWIQDVNSEVFGIKWDFLGLPWAIGLNYTNISDIEIRIRPGDPEAKFDASYFFGSLSSGFKVWRELSFGASIKYLYEGLFNDEATGWGFDFGLHYKTTISGLTVSTVIRNIGSMNALRNVETKLPVDFRLGTAYNFNLENSKLDFTAAAELQKYLDTDDTHINFGGEAVYDKTFALRLGYQFGYEAKGFTGGIGLMWGNLRFDYAYQPFSFDLGSASLFSLQFKF